jgi:hypothetical protein
VSARDRRQDLTVVADLIHRLEPEIEVVQPTVGEEERGRRCGSIRLLDLPDVCR